MQNSNVNVASSQQLLENGVERGTKTKGSKTVRLTKKRRCEGGGGGRKQEKERGKKEQKQKGGQKSRTEKESKTGR